MGVLINLHLSTVQGGDAPGSAPALCPLNVIVGGTRNQSGRASPVWNRTPALQHRSVTCWAIRTHHQWLLMFGYTQRRLLRHYCSAYGRIGTRKCKTLITGYLTHCGRVTQICVLTRWNSVHLQVLLSATPQGGMFPDVSHPQALLGSLVSISWIFQFTKIVSEFVINF